MSSAARCDACGYVARADTQKRALYGLRQHSCEKQRADRARSERGRAREAAVDRTPKPCHHARANHQHGTYACYTLDACRCVPCAVACSQYEATRVRDRAYGREAFVDARPAAAHLRALMAAGLGWKRVAQLADLPTSSVYVLLYGRPDRNAGKPRTQARKATVDKLLAVPIPTLDDLADGANTDPTGTRRRVRALVAHGWSLTALADRTGIDHQILRGAVNGSRRYVLAGSARAIRAAYDELWNAAVPDSPGKTRALARALREGWPPPAAWDDDAIDDPDALPAPGWRDGECSEPGCPETDRWASGMCRAHYFQHRRGTSPTGAADLDEFLHLVRNGEDLERAAQRVGVKVGAIEMRARREGRTDVLDTVRLIREGVAA